jgi:hypothetical protein
MCSVTSTPIPRTKKLSGTTLTEVLRDDEVVTSATLLDRLEARGLSRNAARQVLWRAADSAEVWRSEELVLEGGARLFCKRSVWGGPEFHNGVAAILHAQRPGLHRLLLAVRESVVLSSVAQKLLASPVESRESQPYPLMEFEIAALVNVGAVKWEARGTAAERIADFRTAGTAAGAQAARAQWAQRVAAAKLTGILADQLRRTNFITWGSMPPAESEDFVPFNNFAFDHVGFSRLGPLLRFSARADKPSPTPVLFEVHSRLCPAYAIEGFLERMKRAGMNPTSRLPVVGVVAAPAFERDAWKLAKNAGLMTVDLRAMFGDAALEAMAQVEQILLEIGNEPERVDDRGLGVLGETIQRSVGSPIVADLRAFGFETLVGLVLAAGGWQGIELNKKYPLKASADTSDVSRELDVFGSRLGGDEVYAIECKAEHAAKALDVGYLHRFFCETVPAMISAKFPQGRVPKKVFAEIWTTGQVDDGARQSLATMPLPKNFEVALRDGAQVKAKIPSSMTKSVRFLDTLALVPTEA